jgi:lipopolysaccharide/colanic/teichoic acid biosynthesis glycosyltransferase
MLSIFRLLVPASVLALALSESLLIFASYGLAAYLDPDLGLKFLADQSGWQRIALVALIIVLGMYFRQLYGDLQIRSRILLLQQLILIIGMTFLLEALIAYLNLNWALPRATLISGSALAIGALFVWRVLFSLAIRNKVGLRRVLFLGLSPASAHLALYLIQHPEVGFAPIGYLDSGGVTPAPSDVASLGPASALLTVVEEHRPDWIVLARRAEAKVRQADDFAELHFSGVQTEDAARFYEKTLGRVCAAQVRPEALIFSESLQPGRVSLRLQSMFTYVIAILALPLLLLLLGAVAIFVRLTSRGSGPRPVLLREQRVGHYGELFTMYSFRLSDNRASRVLHRVGLHALPQIWNVLRGEMAFVGPQPDRPAFAAQLNRTIPFHAQRTAVRPGMTGWAQISQIRDGSEGDALRRLEYDMYFIKNVSLLLDLFVLLRWVRETVVSRGSPDA